MSRLNEFVSRSSLRSLPCSQRAMIRLVLNIAAIWYKATISPHRFVLVALPLGETPLATNVDLLSTRKLELGSPQSLNNLVLVCIFHTH